MKKMFVLIGLLLKFGILSAQEQCIKDTLVLLENKIWRAQLPEGKQYSSEMEFRDAIWTHTFLYNGQAKTIETSYKICGDTIKTYDFKRYKILELSDSTLVIQYLPERLTIGVGAVKYINTINSPAKMRENENRLDSIWRKKDIWNKGVAKITGEPIKDLSSIESPRWAIWDYDLTKYYVSQMKYPEELLKKNVAGYSVVMFALDTLGLPRWNTILTTVQKEFDAEVIRLTEELPHCLPCRDKEGKRMECLYTVYVPFLPQHYRDRVKADSIQEEELKQMFVTWESPSRFQEGNPSAVTDYINERLTYNPQLLGNQKQARGIYTISIDSYGEVTEVNATRSCGIPAWDDQVTDIIKTMPRWTPEVNYHGKGEYRSSVWTVSVVFKKDSLITQHKSFNEVHDYNWLIKTLSKSCKYPVRLQKKNQEGILRVAYEIDINGYIINPTIIYCDNRKLKKATLDAFKAVINLPTVLQARRDTLLFQFKLDTPTTPMHPRADVLIFGYSTCDVPVLMRYENLLIAHTNEKRLEVGVPVCYLNERGDTIIPYGKYRFCQTDTIRNIGFVYENESNAKIVCINVKGRKLFNVFKYDNGADYVREGLFRITDDKGLIGFADTLGNIIIKPQFKFAFPFENGKAKVTFSGESKEVPDSNGEKHYWDSSQWFYINKNGKIINNRRV